MAVLMTDSIIEEIKGLRTLRDLFLWAVGRKPPAEMLEVITQDEFTLDVIVRVSPEIYLVFDTS
jgi:hypothetical protein